jgi:6-pyruvoyl-tetrahydropterin synthase
MPMSVTTTYTKHVGFPASHVLAKHPVCGKSHGHQYTVSVTFSGPPLKDNWGLPATDETMGRAMAIVRELAYRDLNQMIPAGTPSVAGIAAYLLERLRVLGVIAVKVHESDTDIEGTAEYLSG